MNYREVYMKIITKAKQEQKYRKKQRYLRWRTKQGGEYYEQHHILPKSLFPLWNKRKNNLILLTAREHFICHMMLDKIYPTSNMFMALWRLVNNRQNSYCIKNSRKYEQIKKQISEKTKEWYKHNPNTGRHYYNNGIKCIFIKGDCPKGFIPGRIISDEHRNKLQEANKKREYPKGEKHWNHNKSLSTEHKKILITCRIGTKHSNEAKEKMSRSAIGRKCSEEVKQKLSKMYKNQKCINKGKKWFTNDIVDVMMYKCPEGFKPGRSKNKK